MSREHRLAESSILAAILVACAAMLGCAGDAPESADSTPSTETAPDAEAPGVMGTIEATLDGEARTWYVVDGASESGIYASAVWMDGGDDGRIVSVGGYDTRQPPIETFELDVETGIMSLGDYEGSAFVISVPVPGDGASFSVDLDPSGGTMIAYMPRASTDMSGMLTSASGSLDVTRADFEAETVRLSGTFAGTLRQMQGDDEVRVENGRFEVSGIPSVDALGDNP
ncbi:MAG: hypothetical protein ACODAB_06625 [Gemmatimonadota bacterium]